MQVGPTSSDKCSYKRYPVKRHRDKRRRPREVGVMQAQVKECLEPPEARRGPRSSEGAGSCRHLGFRFLASKTVGLKTSVVLSHQFVVTCHSSPRKLTQMARWARATGQPHSPRRALIHLCFGSMAGE